MALRLQHGGAMKRALLVLLAMPASALAQTAGAIIADSTTINIAQCTGVRNTEVQLDDRMNIGLTWTVDVDDSITTFPSNGFFRVFASNLQPAAGQANGTSCEAMASGVSGTFVHAQLGGNIAATSATMGTKQSFAMQSIVSAAGLNCTDASNVTVYLCVQWYDSTSQPHGWATTTVSLDRTTPAAPTGVRPSGGDGVLHLTCTGNGDIATYKAKATLGSDVKWSSQASSCSDLTISGLTNSQTYSVVVYGMSSANNPSAASAPADGIPVPTDDFYDHYEKADGQEPGGCSTGAGAAGLVSALGLLALRRRKP